MPIASLKEVQRAQQSLKLEQAEDENIQAVMAFIKGAPDGNYQESMTKKKRQLRGKKTVITVNIDPDLLEEFDEWCTNIGMNRTQAITMQMRKLLQKNTFR